MTVKLYTYVYTLVCTYALFTRETRAYSYLWKNPVQNF